MEVSLKPFARRLCSGRSFTVVVAIILLPALALAQWPEEDSGSFTGFWAMSGTVHILQLPDGGLAAAGGLTGTITIQTSQGAIPSF